MVTTQQAQQFADSLNLPYFETSALTGQNIAAAVEHLLDLVLIRMEKCLDSELVQNGTIKPGQTAEKTSQCSC